MEQGRTERLLETLGQQGIGTRRDWGKVKQQHEAHRCHSNVGKEDTHLLVLEEYTAATNAHIIIQREVQAADNHEHRRHILYVVATEVGYALRMGAETTCGNGAEGVAHGVVKVHRTQPIEEGTSTGQDKIDEQHTTSRRADLRPQLVEPQTGHLCRVDVTVLHLIDRNQGKGEDHNSQTAYPLRQGTPEEQRLGQTLDVVDAGGTRRGETTHRLKEGTRHIHVCQTKIGHHSNNRKDYPRKGNNEEVVGSAHSLVHLAATQKDAKRTNGKRAERSQQKTKPTVLAVEDGYKHGKQQKDALHVDKYAEYAFLHLCLIIEH